MSNAATFLKNVPLHYISILPGLGRRRFTASQQRPLRNSAGPALLFLAGLLGISQPALAADGEFLNISTRAYVGTGDEVMIGGFIIRDGSRRVVIHALGPELTSRGVSNALADPVLRIINTSDPANVRELLFNDNWEDSQGQLISDLWGSALPFTDGSQGSAAVLTLEPGNYTAIVEGKNGTSGIALVEVWRLDSVGADGNFVNISTRGVVRTGDEVMIGGFIIRGGPRQVAIHALGPELTNRGVSNALADPVLRVIDTTDPGNPVELMVNDDWEDSQGQLLADLWGPGLSFTAGSKSSAAVLTLEPGNYTAIVEGKDGSSGIALVEVLRLDSSGTGSLDRGALIALYNATNGANWTNNDNWGTTAPLDKWYGVSVDENNRVTLLELERNQLSGPIPPELANLTTLEELNLRENQLRGPIPAELGNLVNLEFLYLNDNQLTGSIPPELGNLTNLIELEINNNQLSGPIPPELGNLANLSGLVLGSNQLSGPIPVALGNLAKLIWLELNDNQLSGPIPDELGNLGFLQGLFLHNNVGLSGPLPGSFTGLGSLYELSVGGTQLCVPTDAAFQTWLQGVRSKSGVVNCVDDSIDRAALVALYNATNGPNWWNKRNWLSDRPLGEWERVTTDAEGRVNRLELGGNALSGSIPAELGNLTKLEYLNLNDNLLTGPIPAELGNLTNLEYLNLGEIFGDNALTGPIPAELGNLTKLEYLNLYGNSFLRGPIPAELGNLTNLGYLNLGGNQLRGPIPAELGNLTNLETLDLRSNQLTGIIPTALGNLTNLEYLNLDGNSSLSGPLPDSFTSLGNLENLFLAGTQLCAPTDAAFQAWLAGVYKEGVVDCVRGSVAEDRAALVALYNATDGPNWTNKRSWLSDRPLREWYGVTVLPSGDYAGRVESLELGGNGLSGSIPAEMGNLTKLLTLDLRNNSSLSGPLPGSFTSLDLANLYLGGTQLCTPTDEAFQHWLIWRTGIGNRSGVQNCVDSSFTRLTHNASIDRYPSWSPDGRHIAFTSNRDGRHQEIYVMDAYGSDVRRLTNNSSSLLVVNNYRPTWSPDGTKIAFTSGRDGNAEIYVMDADGSDVRRLTNNPASDRSPAWSPNGASIVFSSERNGNLPRIHVMNADGSGVTQLHSELGYEPAWSPNGTKIAFESQSIQTRSDIHVMNADGSGVTRLMNNSSFWEHYPAWSPDGAKIAFTSDRDGNEEIYVMDVPK